MKSFFSVPLTSGEEVKPSSSTIFLADGCAYPACPTTPVAMVPLHAVKMENPDIYEVLLENGIGPWSLAGMCEHGALWVSWQRDGEESVMEITGDLWSPAAGIAC